MALLYPSNICSITSPSEVVREGSLVGSVHPVTSATSPMLLDASEELHIDGNP